MKNNDKSYLALVLSIIALVIVIITLFISCSKALGNTCWECEITRMNGTKYLDKICTDDGRAPQVWDNNGNTLGSVCEKK